MVDPSFAGRAAGTKNACWEGLDRIFVSFLRVRPHGSSMAQSYGRLKINVVLFWGYKSTKVPQTDGTSCREISGADAFLVSMSACTDFGKALRNNANKTLSEVVMVAVRFPSAW